MAPTRARSTSGAKAKSKTKSKSKSRSGGSSKSTPSSRSKTASKSTSKSASASAKSAPKKRGSGKRDLVKTPTGDFFAHRDGEGQFREMDEMGRSLAADRRKKAKTKVASGYGDRGDR
ncbi:MAG: hypothetical protein ABJC61_10540 [Acidobacteriota bacterium]